MNLKEIINRNVIIFFLLGITSMFGSGKWGQGKWGQVFTLDIIDYR